MRRLALTLLAMTALTACGGKPAAPDNAANAVNTAQDVVTPQNQAYAPLPSFTNNTVEDDPVAANSVAANSAAANAVNTATNWSAGD